MRQSARAAYGEITTIASVQNRYNVADRRFGDVLAECERAGIAFLPSVPLDAGDVDARSGRTGADRGERGVSRAQVALAWLYTPRRCSRRSRARPRRRTSRPTSRLPTWTRRERHGAARPRPPFAEDDQAQAAVARRPYRAEPWPKARMTFYGAACSCACSIEAAGWRSRFSSAGVPAAPRAGT